MAETEQLTTPAPPEVHSVDPQDEGSLVDDVIFGGEKGSVADAFEGTDDVEQAIAEPESVPQQEAPEQQVQDNDEVRYQYWQSQADKMKNERDQLQQQFNQLATQQTPAQQEPQPVEEPEPDFPDHQRNRRNLIIFQWTKRYPILLLKALDLFNLSKHGVTKWMNTKTYSLSTKWR